jgi:hypothetical protein
MATREELRLSVIEFLKKKPRDAGQSSEIQVWLKDYCARLNRQEKSTSWNMRSSWIFGEHTLARVFGIYKEDAIALVLMIGTVNEKGEAVTSTDISIWTTPE